MLFTWLRRPKTAASKPARRRGRLIPRLEALEERAVPSAAPVWGSFGGDPQHTALTGVTATQPLQVVHWQQVVDYAPYYNGGDILAHYPAPLITQANTVIVPVKTTSGGAFQLQARSGSDGTLLWTQTTDWTEPPHYWVPPYNPVLTPSNRLFFAGAGGTLYYMDNVDSTTPTAPVQVAFYGLANYQADPSAYNAHVFINTPLTSDASGNVYFGFQVTGSTPLGLQGGVARIAIDPNTGAVTGIRTSAATAANDSNMTKVVANSAPALSNDGQTLYVAVNNGNGTGNYNTGYLVSLNSTTLQPVARVPLKDPSTGKSAYLPDNGTASPMVGPDGQVYFGVLENPFPHNNDRGFLLSFSGDLSTEGTPGAFGWDDTPSLVPRSMVPGYTSSNAPYLLFTKYNNYADVGGNGQNEIAVLDPTETETDPVTGATVMKEVETLLGPTPNSGLPGVREWCINSAVVDPATDCVYANSEDGKLYAWNLGSDTIVQVVTLTPGIGEAYTPTAIGPDGTVYAINNATLFAVGRALSFDFGTSSSPVTAGYEQVTEQSAYNATAEFGWLSGSSVQSADRGVGTNLTRDFNYTYTQATFAVDVPNGTYTVTLQLGDTKYAHQGMGIFFQGTQVDNVSNAAGQVLNKTYVVTVANGQLDLGLQALGGTNSAAVIEGLEIVLGTPPPPPIQYDFGTSTSPVASGYAGVTEQTAYGSALGYGWLSGSDVQSADRGMGTDLTRDFNYTYTQATFAVDLANGIYTVTLQLGDTKYAHQGMGIFFQGSQVDDVSNAAGQIVTKTYTVTVSNGQLDLGLQALGGTNSAAVIEGLEIVPGMPPPPMQYDFGTSASPIASGYAAVTEATAYSTAAGFGWLSSSSVQSYDRGVGTDLTRDFNYTYTQATFAVDVPNGTYTVTLQLGDTKYAHQGMGIFFQGTQVDNVSNAAGQVLNKTYVVTVANGQLDLGLQALGGTNSAAVIEGLEIVPGNPPSQYDFGTSTSLVDAGYEQVTEQTAYSSVTGYGWLSGSSVQSADRGVGTNLTRDFNYTYTQATFAVDVPNGTYTVTLQLGDTVYAHQGMGIFFQGTQVDNVSNAAGQVLNKTYVVTVANGQLDLGLQALGGTNSAAVIEGMEIVPGNPPSQYDFGTSTSPVAPGYAGVTEQTAYGSALGYGWLSGSSVQSADRGVGTNLTRDFNYTYTQATFAVDVPNGTYTVTLQLGDTVYAHQGMGIFFQGTQVDNVSNAAGQIVTKTYTVTVSNGQLDLGLQALGGTNSAAVIEGLEIASA